MTLANELKEFIGAYTAIRDVGLKDRDMDLKERAADREDEKFAADEQYREAMLEIQRGQLDISRQRLTRAGSGRPPSPSEMRAQQRFEWEGQDRERATRERNANAALATLPPASEMYNNPSDGFDFEQFQGAFKKGGLVKRYSEGGLVDDEDAPPQNSALPMGGQPPPARPTQAPTQAPAQAPAQPTGVQPAPAPAALPGVSPAPTQQAPTPTQQVNPEASRIIVSKAAEATDQAARSFSTDIERTPAALGEGSEKPDVDIVSNRGGLSLNEYQEVLAKIDPDGTMAPHLQSAAALAEGYRFFLEQGEPEKAVRFAQQILVAQKQKSQTLGALAMQAIEGGDLQSACRLFNDACNNFPSGHEIVVEPDEMRGLRYTVSENGEVVDQGQMQVAQLQELATGVANGSAFLDQVAQFGAQQQRNPRMTPERALNMAIDTRLEAETAVETLNDAIANGVQGAELRELRDAAEAASRASTQSRDRAIQLGAKRTDVDAAYTQALRVRVPNVPDDMMEERGPGALSAIGGVLGNMFRGPGSMAPSADQQPQQSAPATPPTTSPVTPSGNQPPSQGDIPTVSSEAEFNSLPSGARFRAPDGSVRIKP